MNNPWLKPILFFVFGYLLFVQAAMLFVGVPIGMSGRADFKHLYTAGYMVRTGHGSELYDAATATRFQNQLVGPSETNPPFNHLAFEALLFVPFSYLGFKTAFVLALLVNVSLLALIFLALKPPLVPFLCYFPIGAALVHGQDSFLLLAIFMASFLLSESKRDFLSGAVLALGLFKFQFVLPVALLFLLWKKWKFVAGFLIASLCFLVTSLWISGWNLTYVSYLAQMSAGQNQMYGILPDGMANIRGVITWMFGASKLAVVAASLALTVWASRKRPSFATATLVAFLVSYHAYMHDQLILILPLTILAAAGSPWLRASLALVVIAPTLELVTGLPYWIPAIPIMATLILSAQEKGERWGYLRESTAPASGGFPTATGKANGTASV